MHRTLAALAALIALVALACQPAATTPPAPRESAAASAAPAPPVAAAQPAPTPVPKKIVVAIVSPNEQMAIPWVAQDSGIFARHGFDAEVLVVGGSPRVTQSLIAGDFDYAIAGASSLVRARIQGADPVILATTANTAGSFRLFTTPQSGIAAVSELRGKMVGVSQYGSDADVTLRVILSRNGVDPADVTILQHGGSPQGAAALLTGNLQAAVVGGSAVLTAQRAGMVTLADARDYKIPGLSGTIATTRRHIERDRPEVQRFMRAYVEAIHFFKSQRDETIRILQKYLAGLPEDEVAYLYDEVRDVYQPLPLPLDESVHAVAERETPPGGKPLEPHEFVDPSFLREIERDGLIAALYK